MLRRTPFLTQPLILWTGAQMEKNTLLAFAERRTTAADESTEMLVMKRGTLKKDDCNKWSELEEVKKARLSGYRPMNPCPVYEKNTKTLFLFFICVKGTVSEEYQRYLGCNKTRLCYIKSHNDGQDWEEVQDLTDKLHDVIKDWTTFAVGPGHGIQLSSGRLIIPAYAYFPCVPFNCSHPFALCLYSEDSGETWKVGNKLKKISLECEMAEIFDDAGQSYVYCNARSEGGCRIEAVSENNGEDFRILDSADKLVETGKGGCQGSVIAFPAQGESENANSIPSQNAKTWLFFTHPTSNSSRTNLGTYVNRSPLKPSEWSCPWVIQNGPSGYSDLALIGDGQFACIMECGEQSELERIACVVFTYRDFTEHEKSVVFS
ncbi:sialidase-4-like isoform X2 [Lampris incognitus]|uniref:sialidase-4-like isoform X2 n=1 Tax=Lampris incognitus TaxID=2546036 RepID=UPI0024B58F4D|nr:sialidase-4-like isoform X2 [Lampris incognitus]